MSHKILRLAQLFLVLATFVSSAQNRPLTNDDVVQMVKAGLDEETVVKAIQANDSAFDTSVQGLLALKSTGINKPIIDAMLEAETKKKPAAVSLPSNGSPEGLPDELGIYVKSEQGWLHLQGAREDKREVKRGGFTQWTGIGVGGLHVTQEYRGAHAQLQILERRPNFYARVADPTGVRDFVVMHLEQKKDKRKIEVMEISSGETKGMKEANIRQVAIKRLTTDVFSLALPSDLEPGEYLLSGGTGAYDFGIVAPK